MVKSIMVDKSNCVENTTNNNKSIAYNTKNKTD